VNTFVLYDNIQFTKKGWINRNRFLLNGKDELFTIPVKKDSDFLNVVQRFVATDFDRDKLLNRLAASYRKAPQFDSVFPVVTAIVQAEYSNLFEYIQHSIRTTAAFLGITTPIVVSSSIAIDHQLRAEAKVLALCKAMGADTYVNPIGGLELYSKEQFREQGIALKFAQTRPISYPQFNGAFVPNLSILDVMMFNSPVAIRAMLDEYDLV
jgi:WbqC-like protein family